jgi:hypothetical protein
MMNGLAEVERVNALRMQQEFDQFSKLLILKNFFDWRRADLRSCKDFRQCLSVARPETASPPVAGMATFPV